MTVTQVVVFTREELENIIAGDIFAFVNPGDDREILVMTDERYENWKEPDCGFID